jgi:ABC-type branched-subunit amino acid transport system substrate-binding protein
MIPLPKYIDPEAWAAFVEMRKAMPQFDANRLIGQNIDIFHKNPGHQAQMLASLNSTYRSALNIGVLLPTSGVQALIGQSCKRGADIAPAVLAELGYGSAMKILHADTETNIDVARSRAEKLINDGANVLVGPFDSGAAGAIAQVAEQKGVPFIINIAAAPQITEQGYKFTFRNFPTSPELVRNGLALMRDLFQATATAPRTCVFMHVNDTFGQANRRAIDAILPTLSYLPFKLLDTIEVILKILRAVPDNLVELTND